jgi:hypothetical protein
MSASVLPVAVAAILLVGCSSSSAGDPAAEDPAGTTGPTGSASPAGDPNLWRTDPSEPYPFTTPVPPLRATPVDGVYVRDYAKGSEPIPCRRCAPYRLDSGVAILSLDRGRFTLDHPANDFESSGHFLIDGDRLILFNDAECSETKGVYRWRLRGEELDLEEIDDSCAFDLLRARYFSAAPWPLSS